LTGEIDIATASILASRLETLGARQYSHVVVDATGVTFMDSTGVHALVEGKKRIHENGTRILLVASRPVRRVLDLILPEPLFASRFDSNEEAFRELEKLV
jgi:anti-sigma B factor antagonist